MSTSYVTSYGEFIAGNVPQFNMIDNYVYLHHTNTLIILPTFPESITDTINTNYGNTTIMGRSAPIYSFSNAGPRSFDVQLKLHRDMMNQVNTSFSTETSINIGTAMFSQDKELMTKLQRKDYVDLMINELQSIALPSYALSEKMVNPPLITIRFGDEIFCKGVVEGGVTTSFSGPILANPVYDLEGNEQYYFNNLDKTFSEKELEQRSLQKYAGKKMIGKGKYALVDISFKVTEVDPYDATLVAQEGSFRGLNKTLERNLYKVSG